jgi:hypothetical protein
LANLFQLNAKLVRRRFSSAFSDSEANRRHSAAINRQRSAWCERIQPLYRCLCQQKAPLRRWIALAESGHYPPPGTGGIGPLAISKQLASKVQFNGVGRLRTYISFTHSAFQ